MSMLIGESYACFGVEGENEALSNVELGQRELVGASWKL